MRKFRCIFATLTWCLAALPINFLYLPLYLLPKRQRRVIFSSTLRPAWRLFVYYLRVLRIARVAPIDPPPAELPRGRILVANHPSFMDILVLITQFPQTTCVVKSALYFNPLLIIPMNLGFIRKSLNPDVTIQRCEDFLRQGYNVILFPEGTRTANSQGSLARGFAHLALRTGAVVQPIRLDYSESFIAKGPPLSDFGSACVTVQLKLLPAWPTETAEGTAACHRAAARMTRRFAQEVLGAPAPTNS